MHFLTRPDPPLCLANYSHGAQNWDDLTAEDRQEIRDSLKSMQGLRCAYCERFLIEKTYANNGVEKNYVIAHIEHFRQKNSSIYPQGTFLWDNLFWSCNDGDSCGKHKDLNIGPTNYDDSDLIKMDVDDPDDFFQFISDGTISLRAGLSEPNTHRANETIRVFNLDKLHGDLRARRMLAALPFLDTAKALAEMATDDNFDLLAEFYKENLKEARDYEFFTAVRHTLLPPSLHKTFK